MSVNQTKSIPLVPTWVVAVQILIRVLEDGTDQGKREAREALLDMARRMDEIANELGGRS